MNTELYRPWFAHYEDFVPRTVEIWDKPLYSLLDEAAEAYPRRNALIFQNTRITYKNLRERAELFAGALRRMGVEPGQRVAIMLPNLPQTMIAFWGAIKAGAVVVMTNPLYMEKELLENMQDSGAEHMILLDCSGRAWPRCATACRCAILSLPAWATRFPFLSTGCTVSSRPEIPRCPFPTTASMSLSGRPFAKARYAIRNPLRTRCTIRSCSSIPAAPPVCPKASR